MTPSPELLAPQPQRAVLLDRGWRPQERAPIRDGELGDGTIDNIADDISVALHALDGELKRLGIGLDEPSPGVGRVRFHGPTQRGSTDALLGAEGYRLWIDKNGPRIEFQTPTGAFRALTTLCQWLRLHAPTEAPTAWIQGVDIRDRPDFATRGLLLDISRNRVPTRAELEATIDRLAELKYNQIQLYTEHTFAYPGHEKVWRGWSPLTADDVRHLAEYARRRHMEWVPNQNSFGHMHRWLVHEPYRRLAECPDGIEHPFSLKAEPFSLCPTDPRTLELLEDLYGRLLPLAESPLFNANLDETLDLGLGRSKALSEQLGTEQVYLNFVHQVHGLAAAHGKRLMMWGDIILKRPELIDRLPEDIIALEWGYEADHPFADDCRLFAASGREFYVCPGTSGWSSFSGRSDNALINLASAAVQGQAHGAAGYLVTDWGDHGHLQPPIIGQAGWLAGACFSWNVGSAQDPETLPWGRMLDTWVLRDSKGLAGGALLDLGRVQDATGVKSLNGSPLFYALMRAHLPVEERRGVGLTIDGIDRSMAELDAVLQHLSESHLQAPDAAWIREELDWVASALRFGARLAQERLRIGEHLPLSALPAAGRKSLRVRLDELAESLRPIWLRRSQPGGLEASIERLTAIRPLLEDA